MRNCYSAAPTLLYRASRDGFTPSAFHSRCDYIQNTLVIIRNSNDFVVGGFTTCTWDISPSWEPCKPDQNAFIFNLRRFGNSNYEKIFPSNTTCATRAIPHYGPIFGHDDILVNFKNNTPHEDGWCSFGSAYKCALNSINCVTSGEYLCGSWSYNLTDVEVFKF